MRAQVRHTILRMIQEVLHDDTTQDKMTARHRERQA
jgi:hypothetical protein